MPARSFLPSAVRSAATHARTFLPQSRSAIARGLCFAFAATVVASAFAAPAAWYKWRSKLNGTVICAQVMQGEWEKVSGPFRDAQCEKQGVPGR